MNVSKKNYARRKNFFLWKKKKLHNVKFFFLTCEKKIIQCEIFFPHVRKYAFSRVKIKFLP